MIFGKLSAGGLDQPFLRDFWTFFFFFAGFFLAIAPPLRV
jgi:hypothetical protein